MTEFDRYIAIDWSGAGIESQRVDLRVAEISELYPSGHIMPPPHPKARSWTRAECRAMLKDVLRTDQPRCLVGMDFGFSYPWGADRAVFKCEGWHAMLRAVADLYATHSTARAVAIELNRRHPDGCSYRFDDCRTDFRFYSHHNIAYYRLVELLTPQAISEWYLGSGGTVGFHTITGMAALHDLMSSRERGEIDFFVWPHEGIAPPDGKHLIVECYPALYPSVDKGPCHGDDERDAWKTVQWLAASDTQGKLETYFTLRPRPFGRTDGITFEEQVCFEGWIFGVG